MVEKVAKPEKGGVLEKEYASKEEFYEHYGHLSRGWGNLDHTKAPGGWDTAFSSVRLESASFMDPDTWSITFAAPYSKIQGLDDFELSPRDTPVPGAVVATASTGRILVLLDNEDLRPAFAVIKALELGPRRPADFTLEELTAAVRAPYSS